MSSRDQLLKSIRRHLPQSSPLPDLSGNWIRYDDPVKQFAEVLKGVGGECHEIDTVHDAPALLGDLVEPEKTVVSCIPELYAERFDLAQIGDPHQLADVDLAILPGELAVAENGAVWVTDADVPQRILYFLTQHLALIVPRSKVVSNLHEAYDDLVIDGRPFGTWISGPSKTADIEQSLVLGAHGARTLNVFLIGQA